MIKIIRGRWVYTDQGLCFRVVFMKNDKVYSAYSRSAFTQDIERATEAAIYKGDREDR